jgi:hypothetical protein
MAARATRLAESEGHTLDGGAPPLIPTRTRTLR